MERCERIALRFCVPRTPRTVEDQLCNTNQTEDVDVEHRLEVGFCDVTNLLYTEDKAGIVNWETVSESMSYFGTLL